MRYINLYRNLVVENLLLAVCEGLTNSHAAGI